MRSSPDNEGFKLLSKWNTTELLIRVSFDGIQKRMLFRGTGQITKFDKDALRFTGAGFELILDLEDAGFNYTVTAERGRDPLPSLFSASRPGRNAIP